MRPFALMFASGTLFAGAPAAAEVCVRIDTQSDTLKPDDQRAAQKVVESAFRREGVEVVPSPCDEQYTVYNLKLGKSVQAFVVGPAGERSGRVNTIEELPDIYTQLVRSIVLGTPLSNDGSVTRDSVTSRQAAPRRVQADSFWYGRLGAATVTGGDFNWGPVFGGGYRYELDRFGIDASANLYVGTETDVETDEIDVGVSGSLLKLMGLYFFDPRGSSSGYVGLGVSYGGSAITGEFVGDVDNDGEEDRVSETYAGAGLQGEVSVGFEVLRASTIRAFLALDATLPFYESNADFGFDVEDSRYTPTFGISLAFGFGRSNTTNVNVTQTNY
ncbi:MAG: hypothetical protein AAF658_02980 [Myxococcota bacterium]